MRYFDLKDIKVKLSQEEVLVDIIRLPYYNFNTNNWSDSVKYLIFFIDASKDTIPQFVVINEGQELEGELYSEYSKNTEGLNIKNGEIDKVSYKHFWKSIADKIGEYKTVYVSLGGVYNDINLNTLYNPETGKYLIEEKDIRIVNSARDFVLNKERDKKQYTSTTSALYGFPDFNGNTTKTVDSTDFLASIRNLDQLWIDSLTRGGMKASSLPATKVEVEQIAGTFQKNGWSVKTYTGEMASETNIKQEESPRVLHVATHGYFFEDIPMDKSNDLFLGMDRQRVVQDPMLRSGLLFTGANKTLHGEEAKGENGLLSAAEASLLDLRETELVVLSACETGKGELKNSEGVYGLRKAFADAGAQNIIMSLWKVDDKVTQEFMTRFYEIWLNEKTTIREAFNRTQLEIKAKYPQPYYWGAFILVGE
jgi:CHAT domain-containing protein